MKNNSENNQKVLKEVMDVFYPNNKIKREECLDFMGYPFDNYNLPTLHHITKASVLRKQGLSDAATFDNCACLGDLSHQALHYIENLDIELYNDWNKLFTRINQSRKEFTTDFMDEILVLQERSMKVIDEHNSKKAQTTKR